MALKRAEARERVREDLKCTDYLDKSKYGNYCCPYCGSGTGSNKTGAVEYYKETNTCSCFACPPPGKKARSFDVIDILQVKYGLDYNEALEKGAAALGITIEETHGEAEARISACYKTHKTEKTAKKQPLQPANDKLPIEDKKDGKTDEKRPRQADYSAYYRACYERRNDPAAICYLTARGISQETAEQFYIGYDPTADPANFPGAMTDKGKLHPTPRLIFPANKGYYIARSIDPNTPGAFKAPNPKGASPQIWNEAAIYDASVVFVCEGVFTALSVIEATGTPAIALNSANNGQLLLEALDKKPSGAQFIICFDNDTTPATKERTKAAAKALNAELQARKYNSTVFDITGYCLPGETDINDIMKRDRETVVKLVNEAIKVPPADCLTEFLEHIQTEAYKPYTTGLQFFDELLNGGIIKQTLLLLMAAPGAGKTTLCQQISEEMAARKKPVIYLNLEMSREQMLAKAISGRLARKGREISTTDILQGYNWTLEEKAEIEQAVKEYRQSNYPYLKYNPSNTGSELNGLLDYLHTIGEQAKAAGKDAPAVIVDYLHLISSTDKLDIQELIKQAVTGLKQYAIEYNTFVIGIVAVNRAAMAKGPLSMSSGRDSSNIEYTADYVLTLNYWDIDQSKADPQNDNETAPIQAEEWRRMVLRLPKSRYGQPGKYAKIYFNAASNYFLGTEGIIPDGAKEFNRTEPAAPARRK